MWAHGDVSRQWDPGIQELSWDIPKLHSLWKENPSTSGKTLDLKNWRPGHWITEMWIQLPYHPEFFNSPWYVKDKAMVNTWTMRSVSKSQLSKAQGMLPFYLSSSFPHSSVLFRACRAIALTPHVLTRLGVLRGGCTSSGARALLWHTHLQGSALRPMELCSKACGAIMVVIQWTHGYISAVHTSRVKKELAHYLHRDEKLEPTVLHLSIS